MSAPKREYSRLYHDLVDDPMFSEVYPDDALFGAWSKLLMLGDASWPASAPIPAGISKARLTKLVAVGLIDVSGVRFRVRGMDKERGARSDHGKRGADGRWHGPEQSPPGAGGDDDGMLAHPSGNARASGGHPSGNAEGMPSKDEQSKAEQEQSKDEQEHSARAPKMPDGYDDAPEASALAWLARHDCHIVSHGDLRLHRLIQLVEKHGSAEVLRTFELLVKAGIQDGDTAGFVFKAEDALRVARPTAKRVHELDEALEQRALTERDYGRTAQRRRDLEALPPADPETVAEAMAKMREAVGR